MLKATTCSDCSSQPICCAVNWPATSSLTWSTATSISLIFVSSDANSALSAAALGNPTLTSSIRSTSTLMYGHVETPAHWVNQLLLLRDIQNQTGGFTEFVPLGFVHQNTMLFHQGLSRPGPTLAEHLKIHALARLMLAGYINNIQVSWVKLNRGLSKLCLQAGANDFGGTLMEEN